MIPRSALALFLALLLGAGLIGNPASARAAEPTTKAAAPAPDPDGDVEPAAHDLLLRAADFLRAQPRLAFSADVSYEVYQQDDDSTLEFGELRRYLLRRPDRLKIDSMRRADGRRVTYFDGDRITVSSPDQNAYAFVKLKQHQTLDQALHLLRDRLGIPTPLGELLATDVGKGLEGTFDSGYLVGPEVLDGAAVQHAALRNEDTDIEFWIQDGAQPFVRRVHIAYHTLPGQPRFTARIFDWDLKPDVADAQFVFVPPPGAERVRFAFGGSGTPPPEEEKSGEKKP